MCERDRHAPPPVEEAFDSWERSGVGHFRQPHNFLALARTTLQEEAPELLERLARAGAGEVDQTGLLPAGAWLPEDAQFATIACRRPVFEAALREMAVSTPNVTLRSGVVMDGLVVDRRIGAVVVSGVRTQGGVIEGDLVVDAAGRTSRVRGWLELAGAELPERREQDCGIVYFSRHFRFRRAVEPPGGPYILGGPRGDLGYLAYAVFLGDDRTFCVVLMTAPGDEHFKALRSAEAHQAVASRIPGLAEWVHEDVAIPLGPSLFMGRLANTVQLVHGGATQGVASAGSATPVPHQPDVRVRRLAVAAPGFPLGALLGSRSREASEVFETAHGPISLHDRGGLGRGPRLTAWWSGGLVDPTDPNQSMALALRFVVYAAAGRDPEIFRAVARRIGALDPVDALSRRVDLIERALHHPAGDARPHSRYRSRPERS